MTWIVARVVVSFKYYTVNKNGEICLIFKRGSTQLLVLWISAINEYPDYENDLDRILEALPEEG